MRKTLGAFVLAILLTVSLSAGVMQNDNPAPPAPAPTPEAPLAAPTPTPEGVMQNDNTEGLTAEFLFDVLLGVLALY